MRWNVLVLALLATCYSTMLSAQPAKDVNVVNSPGVTVLNDATNPVIVQQSATRRPFQVFLQTPFPTTSQSFAVPSDKLLVIETVTVAADGVTSSTWGGYFYVNTVLAGQHASHSILAQKTTEPGLWGSSSMVRLYSEPGTTVSVNTRTTSAGWWFATVSGYLIDPTSPSLAP